MIIEDPLLRETEFVRAIGFLWVEHTSGRCLAPFSAKLI